MKNFDFNEALKAIQSGKPITGSDGVRRHSSSSLLKLPYPLKLTAILTKTPW